MKEIGVIIATIMQAIFSFHTPVVAVSANDVNWETHQEEHLNISYKAPDSVYIKTNADSATLLIKDFSETKEKGGYSISMERVNLSKEDQEHIFNNLQTMEMSGNKIYLSTINQKGLVDELVDIIYVPINDDEYYYIVRRVVDPDSLGYYETSQEILKSISFK